MEENKKIEERKNKDNVKNGKDLRAGSEGSNGSDKKLLAVVRISGMVKVRKDIADAMDRLRLRRKYSCVLVDGSDKNIIGVLKKVKFYVAYGSINKKTLVELVKVRGQGVGGRFDAEKVVSGLMSGKKLSDFGLKPFFRLHPPRKGIKSKLQYPKGVLGDNKDDINKLIERML